MNSNKNVARVIGALYLLGFLGYGAGNLLASSVTGSPDFLLTISAHKNTLVFGAFLMLLPIVTDVWRAVLFFPILENHSKRTALTYLSAQIISVVLFDVGVLCLLMIIPLGQYAGGPGADWAKAFGSLLTQSNTMAYQISEMTLALGSGALWLLGFRIRLIPRFLAVWGIVGYGVLLVGTISEIFGVHIGLLLSIPGGVFEIVLPFWLFFKGFQPEAYGKVS
jgi:hypothetical protein